MILFDAFSHIAPREYVTAVGKTAAVNPLLSNLDARFWSMDPPENMQQMRTLGGSPIEEAMEIPELEKRKLFSDNAQALFRLKI